MHLHVVVEIVVRDMNYFEIFDLPVVYNIDADLLTKNYFSLQRDSGNRFNASLINEAYNILKNDIKRAEHFLSLKNISTEKMSSELAIQMFEMRENYESLKNNEEKISFQKQIKKKIRILISSLEECEDNLERFSKIFSELKFLNSFLEKERSDVYSRN